MASYRDEAEPEQLLLGPDGSGSGLATLLAESGLDQEDAGMYLGVLTEPAALTAALNWYRAMDRGVLEQLEPVRVPTLYVWSTADGAFSRAAAEASASWVHAPYTFEVLDGVSHWIPETAPEELSKLVLAHLAGC
jgi:pimeloyl-ACP methyl ester carboxylesterase